MSGLCPVPSPLSLCPSLCPWPVPICLHFLISVGQRWMNRCCRPSVWSAAVRGRIYVVLNPWEHFHLGKKKKKQLTNVSVSCNNPAGLSLILLLYGYPAFSPTGVLIVSTFFFCFEINLTAEFHCSLDYIQQIRKRLSHKCPSRLKFLTRKHFIVTLRRFYTLGCSSVWRKAASSYIVFAFYHQDLMRGSLWDLNPLLFLSSKLFFLFFFLSLH